LGANNTNTTQDHEAINAEAEALAEEFNRLMTTSAYKGKNVFVDNASSEYVSVGGRNAEMTFGIGKLTYTELYNSTARTIVSGPNAAATTFNLAHLPSDGVVAKAYGTAAETVTNAALDNNASYVIKGETLGADKNLDGSASSTGAAKIETARAASKATITTGTGAGSAKASGALALGDVIAITDPSPAITVAQATAGSRNTYAKVRTDDNAFVAGETYVVYSLGDSDGNTGDAASDAAYLKAASASLTSVTKLAVGQKFTVDSDATTIELARINSLVENMTFTKASDTLTKDIEAVQAKINTARVQAGSQYAAMESAVDYTTDLTAQYELGFNTVNDVNFSMETAHLAKNQILQQAATAMLAQANQGQQGLLQLIQG
jgi:flagellin